MESGSANSAFQPRKFTSYERDMNGTDEAMFRRYNRWHSRFDQPDPYDGSYFLGVGATVAWLNPDHARCGEAKQMMRIGEIIAEEFSLEEFRIKGR